MRCVEDAGEENVSVSEASSRQSPEGFEDRRGSRKVSLPVAMPEMTENESPTKRKHRKKNRETHNAVERHRKKKINSGIKRIGELIPCSPTLKQSQNMILDQALKYITELKRQNDELLLNGGEKEQADEILRLRKQLEEIQKENGRYIDLLKANDICLYDDPSIHWRGHLKNAKVPLIIPTNEGHKNIIVYSNGSPLGVNNQSVSFNVSQNLQKQTANVAPVKRTCSLVTPATTASVYSAETKMCPQTTVCASTSHQHIPLCLPVTIPAQTILEISTLKVEPNILHSATTSSQDVFQSGTANQLQFVSSSMPQSNQNVSASTVGQQNAVLSDAAMSHLTSVPLTASGLTCEVPSTSILCSGFLENVVGTITDATSAQSTRVASSGRFSSVNADPITEINNKGRLVATSAAAETIAISAEPVASAAPVTSTLLTTTVSTLPVSCLDSGWSLPSSLPLSGIISDLRQVSNLTRIPSAGNTQTTWTTLQVAGNTIQPLSHMSHNILPMLLNEQVNCTGSIPVTNGMQPITGISLNNALRVEGQPVEQVTVTLPSCPSLPVQPLVSPSQLKPQTAKNVVPLNSAMQVIQMASPIGSAVTPTQTNQNVIILQPPNTTPCPPVMRAEIPTQAVGQQIVIIQATPNANSLPLLSAQPPAPTRMPIHGANPVICTNNPVQNTPTPQTFGGKHLVHILPRPSQSSSASSSTQSFSVTMSNQQQPPTISLNGQLFALQPMVSSPGTSNPTAVQLIQPPASEDPNKNVALNTFGALASLNQSISQMAGPSCLQLPLNPSTNTPPAASCAITPARGTSLYTTAASPTPAENVTVLQNTTNPGKPSLSSNVKSKRLSKKSSTKKRYAPSKDVPQVSKAEDPAMSDLKSVEAAKPLSNTGRQTQPESIALTSKSPAPCQTSTVASGTVRTSNSDSNESVNSEQLVTLNSKGELNVSAVQSSLLSKSTAEKQFLSTSVCKDLTPLAEEICRPQIDPLTSSVLSECSTECVAVSYSTSSAVKHISDSYLTETSNDHSSINIGCVSEEVSTSEPDISKQDSSSIMQAASDLLEGQGLGRMLYDIAKEKSSAIKSTSLVQNEQHHFSTADSKSMDSNFALPGKVMNTEGENMNHEHICVSEQEVVISSSSVSSRQADSPMSTSSGSNRSFSVASMLPDTAREDVTNSASLAPTFNVCTPSEHTDIVALAARAIFDQGNLEKRKASIQVDARDVASKTAKESPLEGNGHQPFTQISKDNCRGHFEAPPDKKHTLDSRPQTNAGGTIEKPSCSVSLEASSISLQMSTPQSQNSASLSINNLIHPGGVTHPFVSCSNVSQPPEQIAVTTTVNLPRPSVYYNTQSPAVTSEYSQEHFHAIRTTAMQAPQTQEANQKQNRESRKESAKRNIQEDHLVSTAKRQKQCEATPIRRDRMSSMSGTSNDLVEQTQMLVSQIPHNSSNSIVSVSSQGPTNSFNTLFPTNVTFVNSALRQTDIRCNTQALLVEQQQQQGQAHNPHLQQRLSSQAVANLHNSNPYLKQQQVGQLREQHHMYQQHHITHAEGSIHSQAHNVHQQRAIQQDVQMQKKRNLVQGGQATQLSLQQKHHGSEQGRQKGNQTHAHHQQQMQQQIQQHFTAAQGEKSCDIPSSNRNHHGTHPQNHLNSDIMHQQQQEVGNRQQGSGASSEHASTHNQLQRLMTSRSLEQHMVSQPSIVSRQSNMTCTPHRQERHRVSSYSAEALIGKTSSNSELRMGTSVQGPRVPDQLEVRTYLDVSRNKGLSIHNMQSRISVEHAVSAEVQRLSDCQSYKPGGSNQQPTGAFDVQTSRNSEMGNTVSSLRSMQSQAFRIGQNSGPALDRQKRLPYVPVQGIPIGNAMPPRESENSCHQSFMQSLLGPHLGEQVVGNQRLLSEHQRNTQCGPSTALEYSCPPGRESVHLRRDSESQNSCDMSMGVVNSRNNSLSIPFSSSSSSGEAQGRNTSPHISIQKSNPMRMTDSQSSKSHLMTVSTSMHGIARSSHPAISHGNADQRQTSARQSNPPVTQRSRHPLQDNGGSKVRQPRSSNQRHGNLFDPSLPHLPLAASSGMILGRQPSSVDKRASIVRFMSDGSQLPNENMAPDQHTLSQNFGFPFIPDGGMNPTINGNTSFIPPVTQPSATRTPALIPVDPQNTLPSFYPPYSPAHPSLSNDLSIPYFSNQMFTNPGTEKPNGASLNNRFGSILSPPRPVGFAQPSFPLLPDMPPMHMANPSHLPNFNLTSLFPEIATALPPDGSAMSPLLSIVNSSASDSSKQSSNRPAHNISHILGHDCSSAV